MPIGEIANEGINTKSVRSTLSIVVEGVILKPLKHVSSSLFSPTSCVKKLGLGVLPANALNNMPLDARTSIGPAIDDGSASGIATILTVRMLMLNNYYHIPDSYVY